MEICFVCGKELPDGATYCMHCGGKEQKKEDSYNIEKQLREEKKIKIQEAAEKRKQKQKAEQESRAARTAVTETAGEPGDGATIIPIDGDTIDDEEESPYVAAEREKAKKLCVIFLLAGALLLLPAVVLPWMHTAGGAPVEAFSLPLSFVFFEASNLSFITVGLLLGFFILIVASTAVSRIPSATIIQLIAVVCLMLSMGGILFGLKFWNAYNGLGARFFEYSNKQVSRLPDTRVFTPLIMQDEANVFDKAEKLIISEDGGADFAFFLTRILGPGVWFPIIAAILLFWTSFKYAHIMHAYELRISPVLVSLSIVLFFFAFGLYLISRASPSWWHTSQATILLQLNRNEAAEATLKKCLEKPTPGGECEIALAAIYSRTNKLDEAKKLIIKVAREKPYYPEGHSAMGDLYFYEQQFEQAADEYRTYLELRPGSQKYRKKLSDTLISLAVDDYGQARFKDALDKYLEANEILVTNRSDSNIQYKIGECYYQLGNVSEALKHFGISADIDSTNLTRQIEVAKTAEEKGNYDMAIKYFKKAIEIKPDHAIAFVYIGNIYRDIYKDKKTAIKWYRDAISVNDVSTAAQTARNNIERLEDQ